MKATFPLARRVAFWQRVVVLPLPRQPLALGFDADNKPRTEGQQHVTDQGHHSRSSAAPCSRTVTEASCGALVGEGVSLGGGAATAHEFTDGQEGEAPDQTSSYLGASAGSGREAVSVPADGEIPSAVHLYQLPSREHGRASTSSTARTGDDLREGGVATHAPGAQRVGEDAGSSPAESRSPRSHRARALVAQPGGALRLAASASPAASHLASGAPQGAVHTSARPPCVGVDPAPHLLATRRPSLLTDLQDPRRVNGASRHNFDDAQGSRPGSRPSAHPLRRGSGRLLGASSLRGGAEEG